MTNHDFFLKLRAYWLFWKQQQELAKQGSPALTTFRVLTTCRSRERFENLRTLARQVDDKQTGIRNVLVCEGSRLMIRTSRKASGSRSGGRRRMIGCIICWNNLSGVARGAVNTMCFMDCSIEMANPSPRASGRRFIGCRRMTRSTTCSNSRECLVAVNYETTFQHQNLLEYKQHLNGCRLLHHLL